MALPRQHVDLWGQFQRQVFTPGANVRVVPFVQTPTYHLTTDEIDWHTDRCHAKADALFAQLTGAIEAGRTRKAARLRTAWLHQLQQDRIACAREVARARGLRMDPIGPGPVFDRPTVHYRDRLPWGMSPIDRFCAERLPSRAASVLEEWNGSGRLFDALYVADEPRSSGHFGVTSLIGVFSPDGRSGDWYVLDRWAS